MSTPQPAPPGHNSEPKRSKVKVHTTWLGRQYVDADELMKHPDVQAAVKKMEQVLGPIIREQRRFREQRAGADPDRSSSGPVKAGPPDLRE